MLSFLKTVLYLYVLSYFHGFVHICAHMDVWRSENLKGSVFSFCHIGLGLNPSPQVWLQAPLPTEHPFLMHPYPHSVPKLLHCPFGSGRVNMNLASLLIFVISLTHRTWTQEKAFFLSPWTGKWHPVPHRSDCSLASILVLASVGLHIYWAPRFYSLAVRIQVSSWLDKEFLARQLKGGGGRCYIITLPALLCEALHPWNQSLWVPLTKLVCGKRWLLFESFLRWIEGLWLFFPLLTFSFKNCCS